MDPGSLDTAITSFPAPATGRVLGGQFTSLSTPFDTKGLTSVLSPKGFQVTSNNIPNVHRDEALPKKRVKVMVTPARSELLGVVR